MGTISRGIKNAFRNTIRTISITFILGLSIAMALIMLLALKTVQSKITSVKGSIGNIITVSPAGVRGFEGGGELLTSQNASDMAALPHVTKVIQTITDRLRTSTDSTATTSASDSSGDNSDNSTTSLTSGIDPGSFGQRQQKQGRMQFGGGQARIQSGQSGSFSMPLMVIGTSDIDSTASLSVSQFNLTSGSKFDSLTSDNVAMIGTDLATKNNLSVGGTFKAYGQDIKVVGIFDSGNKFTNGGTVVFPLRTLQNLSGQADQVNSMIVQTDSIDTLASVSQAIKDKLGSDKVDVVNSQDSSNSAIAPLENIKTISTYSLFGSLVAGSIIIFLTMIMIVRERRREIGVLKAIGSSNIKITSQFMAESMVLTLLGSVLGMVIGVIFSNPVLNVLVNNTAQSAGKDGGRAFGGPGGGAVMMRLGSMGQGAGNALRDLHAVVGLNIILYGLLAAVVIGIIGSAIPSFFIAKIRPAEVMRAE